MNLLFRAKEELMRMFRETRSRSEEDAVKLEVLIDIRDTLRLIAKNTGPNNTEKIK